MPPDISSLLWADGLWTSMFHLGPSVLEKVARPIIVYAFLVFLLRVFGKRELAQLNPFDLVVLLCLSNTVQNAIIGEDNSVTGGLIGALALCMINYVVIRFLFRHRRLDQIIQGRSTVLIKGGRLQKQAMGRELINRAELLTIAHRQGFASLEEVECCTLEPGGTFVVEGKSPRQSELHHSELLKRIDGLTRQIEELSNRLGPGPSAEVSGRPS
jgi:uncharacterized membrane protein YcaP (DUF421 family)